MTPAITSSRAVYSQINANAEKTCKFATEAFRRLPLKQKLIEIGMINANFNLLFKSTLRIPVLSATGQIRWNQLMQTKIRCHLFSTTQGQYAFSFLNYLQEKGIASSTYLRGGYAAYISCLSESLILLIQEYLTIHKIPLALFSEEFEALRAEEEKEVPPFDVDWLDIIPSTALNPIALSHLMNEFFYGCPEGVTITIPQVSKIFPLPTDYVITIIKGKGVKTDRVTGRLHQDCMFSRDNIRLKIAPGSYPNLECTDDFWQMVIDRKLKIVRLKAWHETDFRIGHAALQLGSQGHMIIEETCKLQSIFNYAVSTRSDYILDAAIERADEHTSQPLGYLLSILVHYAHSNCLNDLRFLKEKIKYFLTMSSSIPPEFASRLTKCLDRSGNGLAGLHQMALLLTQYEDAKGIYRAEQDLNGKGLLTFSVGSCQIIFPQNCKFKVYENELPFFASLVSEWNLKLERSEIEIDEVTGSLEIVLLELSRQKLNTPLSDAFLKAFIDYLTESTDAAEQKALSCALHPWFQAASNRPHNLGWIKALLNYSYKYGMLLWHASKIRMDEETRLSSLEEVYTNTSMQRPNSSYAQLEEEKIPDALRIKLLMQMITSPLISQNILQSIASSSSEHPDLLLVIIKKLPPKEAYALWKTSKLPSSDELNSILDEIVSHTKDSAEWFFESSPSIDRVKKFFNLFSLEDLKANPSCTLKFVIAMQDGFTDELLKFNALNIAVQNNALQTSPEKASIFLAALRSFHTAANLFTSKLAHTLQIHQCDLFENLSSSALQQEFFSIFKLYKIPLDNGITTTKIQVIKKAIEKKDPEAHALFQNCKEEIKNLSGYFEILINLYKLKPSEFLLDLAANHITWLPFAKRKEMGIQSSLLLKGEEKKSTVLWLEKICPLNGIDEKTMFEVHGEEIIPYLSIKRSFALIRYDTPLPFKKALVENLLQRADQIEKNDLTILYQWLKTNASLSLEIILRLHLDSEVQISLCLQLFLFLKNKPTANPLIFMGIWKEILNASLKVPNLWKELIPFFQDYSWVGSVYGEIEAPQKTKEWIEVMQTQKMTGDQQRKLQEISTHMNFIYPKMNRLITFITDFKKHPVHQSVKENVQAMYATLCLSLSADSPNKYTQFQKFTHLLEEAVAARMLSPNEYYAMGTKLIHFASDYPFDQYQEFEFDPIEHHLAYLDLNGESETGLLEWNGIRNQLLDCWIGTLKNSRHSQKETFAGILKKRGHYKVPQIATFQAMQATTKALKIVSVKSIANKNIHLDKAEVRRLCKDAVTFGLHDPILKCIQELSFLLNQEETKAAAYSVFKELLNIWGQVKKQLPQSTLEYKNYLKAREDAEKIILEKKMLINQNKIFYCDLIKSFNLSVQNIINDPILFDFGPRDPILDALGLECVSQVDKIQLLKIWIDTLSETYLPVAKHMQRVIAHITAEQLIKKEQILAHLKHRIWTLTITDKNSKPIDSWTAEILHIFQVADLLPRESCVEIINLMIEYKFVDRVKEDPL